MYQPVAPTWNTREELLSDVLRAIRAGELECSSSETGTLLDATESDEAFERFIEKHNRQTQRVPIKIEKGTIVGIHGKPTVGRWMPVTLQDDVYVDAIREDDGCWLYSVGGQTYSCGGAMATIIENP